MNIIKMTGLTKKPFTFGPEFVKTWEPTHVRMTSTLTLAYVCFTPNNKKEKENLGEILTAKTVKVL